MTFIHSPAPSSVFHGSHTSVGYCCGTLVAVKSAVRKSCCRLRVVWKVARSNLQTVFGASQGTVKVRARICEAGGKWHVSACWVTCL
jgi:hypothetical protein